jgi:hypothetical protein
MHQSPLIMLKRNSTVERDNLRTLDVNRIPSSNYLTHKQKYNARNRYEDELFPIPTNQPQSSDKIYVIDIPKYVTVEYDMMIWCDFTAQLNDVIDQVIPYGRYAWGNDGNRFATSIGNISFETVNTVGEDRLVRATVPLTVQGVLLAEQESRVSTLKKMYSVKKVTFDYVVTDELLFTSTIVPQQIIQMGGGTIVTSGGNQVQITNNIFTYLVTMSDKQATYVNSTTVSISAYSAVNPVTLTTATKNEFDVYINGQYIDKVCYTWTPSDTTNQSIVFDTTTLGYTISSDDVVIVNGRWA